MLLLWIAEDAPSGALLDALLDQGYVLLHAEPGERAIAAATRLAPQAVLLEGAAVRLALGRLRHRLPRAVLVVRAPQLTLLDEVLLLDLGADLVADPTDSSLVLLARLRRWLRRASGERTVLAGSSSATPSRGAAPAAAAGWASRPATRPGSRSAWERRKASRV